MPKNDDRTDMYEKTIQWSNWQLFMLIAVINFLIAFWTQQQIYTKELYYSLLSDQMEISRIDQMINLMRKYSYLSIALIPAVLFIKFLTIALILQLILLLRFVEIKFTSLLRIVMLSSLIVTAGQVFHFIRLYLSPLQEINRNLFIIKPFSLAEFVDINVYPQSALAIFNRCGLFDIAWMLGIYYGLCRTQRINRETAATAALILWTSIVFINWSVCFFAEKIQ